MLVCIHARIDAEVSRVLLPQAVGTPCARPPAVEGDRGNFGEILRVGRGFSRGQAGG